MNEEQAELLLETLIKQNQILSSIDWKLWELFKHLVPQDKAPEEK